MAYTAAPRDPPPQSQGFRSISPQPGYQIQHPTQIQIPPQLRYPHPHQQPRPPPTSFPNPTPTRRPLPTPKLRPESLPPPARAAQTPAPSRPAPIPAPAPSRPAILAHAASLESTNINNHTRRPLPNPGAKSTKHASLDLRAQLENNNPTEPDLNSAVSSQTSASSFSPFSAASGASSFSSPGPSSSAAQSFAFPNHTPSSAYSNTPPSASFRNTPLHSFSGPGPSSGYPHVAPIIDVRALPLSSAPAKFTPHWKRDLPGPGPLPQPNESSSRVGPFMERRSTVSGSAAPSALGTNGFPPPATSTSHSSVHSVSPERNPTSVIDRAQTIIHRAQTQTSSGRRPLPSIGNRSPPVPPLPGSSRSPPEPGGSRSPPVPGSSRSPPAIPGSSQSQQIPGGSRWPPEPGSSRGTPIPDSFRSPPVMSSRPPPISSSSRSPQVPASSVSQITRPASNAPSTSSTLTNSPRLSSSTIRSMHSRMPATADDESNTSDVGDEYDEKFDGRQEGRGYSNTMEDYRHQHGRYNEQNEAHRGRDIRSAGEPGNVSPQHGIRDLPRRTHPSQPSQPQSRIQERQWTRTRPTRSATLPTPPSQSPNDIQENEPQSLTLRMAALGLSASPQPPSHMQNDLSRNPSVHSSMQSSRSSSPSFDLGSHPLLQRVPSAKEQELENLSKGASLKRGKSVIEGHQRHPFASTPVERRVSGRSRSLVREQERRSMSPAREQSSTREPSPTRSQWPQNIPPLPRVPLSSAGTSPFSPGFNASAFSGDANGSPTRSAFTRPASPLKNSVLPSSGFSRPTSPSKSPLPTPPARAEAGGTHGFPSPRKASGGKGPFGPQNQNSRSNSPQKSSNAYASPTLPSSSSPPKLAYLSNSSARNAFPPSAFPSSSFPTSSSHSTTSNSHIMERQRQKQRAYASTYDLDDEPPVSPLRERVGLPSPSVSRSPSPSDLGARMGRPVSRGPANKDQDYGYCNEDDGGERSPSPIRFAKRSSNQFSVLEMDFVGEQVAPRWHRTPASRGAGGRANDEGRRADAGVPVISLPGGHVDFDKDYDNDGGGAVPSSKTQESPPRIAVSSATPPRVAGSRATPPRVAVTSSTPPRVAVNASTPPRISVSGSSPPRIAVSGSSPSSPRIPVSSPSMRQTSVSSPSTPRVSVSIPSSSPRQPSSLHTSAPSHEPKRLPPPPGQDGLRGAGGQNNGFNAQGGGKISGVLRGMRGNGLSCAGCGGPIIGRIVSAMGQRWHPGCFRCSACNELLEHVSSFEHEGKPYCHLDYHENFAPRCFHCKTAIIDERFITLDDEALGKRTYHEQHFFCAECGDPFLPPSSGGGGLTVTGDGEFDLDDDVGFTVYKGHPYCEACHVRLRMPKCKRCNKSIRDGMRAVEALKGKWCWGCFVCEGCKKPFEDPSFFLRENKPFCEPCFSLILRNDV